jgi:ribosomal protein S18 acetylase RimI-like enzyme
VVPFALTPEDIRRLTSALIGPDDTRGFGVHLVDAGDDAALLSLQVAADVFLDSFGNTAEELLADYAALLPSLTHLLVVDRPTRTVVGTLVLQRGPLAQLKTLVDIARPPWSRPAGGVLGTLEGVHDDGTTADLLMLAVRREYRNRAVAPILCYAGWATSWHLGVERWLAMLDDPLLPGLDLLTGGAVHRLDDSRPYLGSPGTTPVTLRLRTAEDTEFLRRTQRVGALAASRATFDSRLEPIRKAFQLLPTAPAPVPVPRPAEVAPLLVALGANAGVASAG